MPRNGNGSANGLGPGPGPTSGSGSSPSSSSGAKPSPVHPTPSGLRQRRLSTTTTAAATPESTTQTLETALSRHIHWDDLPALRRDNTSIHTGYRSTSNSLLASLHSLLYLHNESVNIWTHLLGALALTVTGAYLHVLIAPRYASATAADVVVLGCFFGGGVCCLGMSATYHMLCNHSERVAKWGNKLDYTGIVLLIVGSYVPALWYGFFCREGVLTVYLGAVSAPACMLLFCFALLL
jgi:adiponectin receptor